MTVTRRALTRRQKRHDTAHAPHAPSVTASFFPAGSLHGRGIGAIINARNYHRTRSRRTTVTPNSSFAELMTRLHQGDQEAARRIFQTFSQRLIALARSRLHGLIRVKTDPEDIMASVFKSFFRRDAEEPFQLSGWDSLWSLLTLIT